MDTVGSSNLQNQNVSYFDGSTWQLIGYRIFSVIVCTITLGIAYPWMLCMVKGWETGHTVINGRRLKFNGHGHQLIGKYLLWMFLTIFTLGIYGIWFGLGMKKWVVKHTVYADETAPVDSYFSGGAGGYFGIHIFSFILTLFTLGLGKAWAKTMVLEWETGHTHIGGSPLEFGGRGGQLFLKYLLLMVLTPLTLGIYALCFTVIYLKWQVKNTDAVYQSPEVQARARGQEITAIQNFVKYRLAANDQEVAAVKSGYTGMEDDEALERLAGEDNPFATYHLAKKLKGDSALYEGRALELLQKAADGKYHPALLELAKQLSSEQAVSMLVEAAQCGSADASWLLVGKYQEVSELAQAAYWFKVALEWGVPDAEAHADEYEALVRGIALQLSENRRAVDEPKGNSATSLALGIVGVLIYIVPMMGLLFDIIPIVRFVISIRYIPVIGLMLAIVGLFTGIAGIQRNKKGRIIAGIFLNLMSLVLTLFSWAAGIYPGYDGLRLFVQEGPQRLQMENVSIPSQESEVSTELGVEENAPTSEDVPLTVNEDPELEAFFNAYYMARGNGDEAGMLSAVDNISENDLLYYVELAKYIDYYSGLEIYCKQGLEEGAVIAYLYYKMGIVDFGEVPGYEVFYICRGENNGYYIRNQSNFTQEEKDYFITANNQFDVLEFINRVTVECNEVYSANMELMDYVNMLDFYVRTTVEESLADRNTGDGMDSEEEKGGLQGESAETDRPW